MAVVVMKSFFVIFITLTTEVIGNWRNIERSAQTEYEQSERDVAVV